MPTINHHNTSTQHRLPLDGYVDPHTNLTPIIDVPSGSVSISPQIGGQKLILDKDTLAPSGTSITDFLPNTELKKQVSDGKKISPYYDSIAPHPDKVTKPNEKPVTPDDSKASGSGFFSFIGAAAAAAASLVGDAWRSIKSNVGQILYPEPAVNTTPQEKIDNVPAQPSTTAAPKDEITKSKSRTVIPPKSELAPKVVTPIASKPIGTNTQTVPFTKPLATDEKPKAAPVIEEPKIEGPSWSATLYDWTLGNLFRMTNAIADYVLPSAAVEKPENASVKGLGSTIYDATLGNIYKASQWVWGLINGSPSNVSQNDMDKMIGADKAADVKKIINGFHPLINKVTRDYIAEMNEAKNFDQLIIQIMKNYVQNDKEIMQSIKENSLAQKYKTHRDAQDAYTKKILAFRQSSKDNKFWSWAEGIATTAGLASATYAATGVASLSNPLSGIVLCVIIGSYLDKHIWSDKYSKIAADQLSTTFGDGSKQSKANCLNYFQTGLTGLSVLYAFGSLGYGSAIGAKMGLKDAVPGLKTLQSNMSIFSTGLQGAVNIGRTKHEDVNNQHQAQILELSEELMKSEKKLQGTVKELQHMVELIQKSYQRMGKDLLQGNQEAITSLFQNR